MLEKMTDTMANFMNKTASWLTLPSLPWNRFAADWSEYVGIIAPWNRIFPLTDLMLICGLVLSFAVALMAFYTVVLIKSFIPMLGGK